VQLDHLEPVVEILPEIAAGHAVGQVAVGGSHHAHVDLAALVLADAPDLPLLQRSQELDLHARRNLADLVEQQRPAVGGLEQARPILRRARERAPRVAEELAFEQGLGDGAAVDCDKRPAARVDSSWTSRATRSLPEPLSPVMSTVESTLATRRARSTSCAIAALGDDPERLLDVAATRTRARRCRRNFCSAAFSVSMTRWSETSRQSLRRLGSKKRSSSARSSPHSSRVRPIRWQAASPLPMQRSSRT
jgi:hypothetical protein